MTKTAFFSIFPAYAIVYVAWICHGREDVYLEINHGAKSKSFVRLYAPRIGTAEERDEKINREWKKFERWNRERVRKNIGKLKGDGK